MNKKQYIKQTKEIIAPYIEKGFDYEQISEQLVSQNIKTIRGNPFTKKNVDNFVRRNMRARDFIKIKKDGRKPNPNINHFHEKIINPDRDKIIAIGHILSLPFDDILKAALIAIL